MSSSRGVNSVAQAQEEFDRVRELKMFEFSIEAVVLVARLPFERSLKPGSSCEHEVRVVRYATVTQ
jgi:hypothetical protein